MVLDIGEWQPYRVDLSPVSVGALSGERMAHIVCMAFNLESELLFYKSAQRGNAGTLARENLLHPSGDSKDDLKFGMIFTYSFLIEKVLKSVLQQKKSVQAGLAFCSIWNGPVLLEECKVIALESEDPVLDEDDFLTCLEKELRKDNPSSRVDLAYFAEKFGYRRFAIPYETENVIQMEISSVILDYELEETFEVVGPLPEVIFPEGPEQNDPDIGEDVFS